MAIARNGVTIDRSTQNALLRLFDERTEDLGAIGIGSTYRGNRQIFLCSKLIVLDDGVIELPECTIAMTGVNRNNVSSGANFTAREGRIDMPRAQVFFGTSGGSMVFGSSFPAKTGDGLSGDWSGCIFHSNGPVNFNMGAESTVSPINFTRAIFGNGIVGQFIPGRQFAGVTFGGGHTTQAGTNYNYRAVNVADRAHTITFFWQCDHTGWLAPGSSGGAVNQAINMNPVNNYNQNFCLVNPRGLPPILSFGNRSGTGAFATMYVHILQAWNPRFIDSITLDVVTDIRIKVDLSHEGRVNIARKTDIFNPLNVAGYINTNIGNSDIDINSEGHTGLLITNHQSLYQSRPAQNINTGQINTGITNKRFFMFSYTHETYMESGAIRTVMSESNDCAAEHGVFSESDDTTLEVNPLAVLSYETAGNITLTPTLDDIASLYAKTCYDDRLEHRHVKQNAAGALEFSVPLTLASGTEAGIGMPDDTTAGSITVTSIQRGAVFTDLKAPSIITESGLIQCNVEGSLSIPGRTESVPGTSRATVNDFSNIIIDGQITVTAPTGYVAGSPVYLVLNEVTTRSGLTIGKASAIDQVIVLGLRPGAGVTFGAGVIEEPRTSSIIVNGVANRSVAVINPASREVLYYRAAGADNTWTSPSIAVSAGTQVEIVSRRPGYPTSESVAIDISAGGTFTFTVGAAAMSENVDGAGESLYSGETVAGVMIVTGGSGSRFIEVVGSSAGVSKSIQEIYDATQQFSATEAGMAYPVPTFHARLTTGSAELLLNGYALRTPGSDNIVTVAGGTIGGLIENIPLAVQSTTDYGDIQFASGSDDGNLTVGAIADEVLNRIDPMLVSIRSQIAIARDQAKAAKNAAQRRK